MPHSPFLALTLAAAATLPALPAPDSHDAGVAVPRVEFAESLAAAREASRAGGRLLVLVVTRPHAPGNAGFVADCLADDRIAALAGQTVNVRLTPAALQDAATAQWLERTLLGGRAEGVPVAPQIVFIDPDDRLVLAAAGRMVPGQVEWAWATALARHGIEVEASERVRPPLAWSAGDVFTWSADRLPPDAEQIAAMKERALKDPSSIYGDYRNAVHCDDPRVIDRFASTLGYLDAGHLLPLLAAIESSASRAWSGIAAPSLRDNDPQVRVAAASALRALADRDAVEPLLRAWKSEKDPEVRAALVDALAHCGAGDRRAVRCVLGAAGARRPELRRAAVLALGALERHGPIRTGLGRALDDGDAGVRRAAAEVVRARRDPRLADLVEAALAGESDDGVRAALEAAGRVVARHAGR